MSRDLETAGVLRGQNADWALAIAYNAMLQACNAVLAAYGYRAKGEASHRTMIEFVRAVLPECEDLLARLDRLRRRRHRAIYDVAGQVSAAELRDSLDLASRLVPVLRAKALEVLGER